MPVDNKRINGPEVSFPYSLYSRKSTKSSKDIFDELHSTGERRSDGRKADEMRKIFMETGVVSQAKGSAYIELQNTKVIVSVFDPREIPNKNDYSLNGELYCEFKYAPFSCKRRRLHQQDSEEKEYSVIIRRALESVVCRHEFPNFQVDIYALVLENDGCALGATITCAGLALAHAGTPMYDLVSAVTVGMQGEQIFLDPTSDEELICNVSHIANSSHTPNQHFQEHGIVILSLLSTHQQISELYQTGCLSLETLKKTIHNLIEANKQVISVAEKCLVKFVKGHLKNKQKEQS